MAIHRDKNFSYGRDQSAVKGGDTLWRCNCAQAQESDVFPGVSGLTFENCNLKNAVPPADATIIGGQHILHFQCSNIHTDWVDKGLIDPEPVDCPHAKQKTVVIDSETVVEYYEYDEFQKDEAGDPLFISFRHIEDGKLVDGKAVE